MAAEEAVARALDHARSLDAERSEGIAQRLIPELQELAEHIASSSATTSSDAEPIGGDVVERSLADAVAALRAEREAVTQDSRQNRALAGRVGTSVALLGVCGAAAGLVAGFGVARGVARSVEELGGAVHSLHDSLIEGDPLIRPPTELRELIAAMSHVRNQTAGMVTELERSRESAARADQLAAVGQLAAGIAHELRNPLTAIKLLVDSALDESTGLDERELGVIAEEIQRMQQMLQTFLDFARPPKPAMRQVGVDDLCRQAVEVARPRARRLGIEIELHDDPQVRISADPQQLRQVLLNLLINAIDAQPAGGRIRLRYSTVAAEDAVAIEVVDDGSGIDEDVIQRIFEPFVSTKDTGVGLGLAVSRRIVQSHGGTLTAANLPDGGAVFRIVLPFGAVGSA